MDDKQEERPSNMHQHQHERRVPYVQHERQAPKPIDRTIEGMTHHTPSGRAQEALAAMRLNFKTLAHEVADSPKSFGLHLEGRCEALVFTKLEEALMWATKGIVLTDARLQENEAP